MSTPAKKSNATIKGSKTDKEAFETAKPIVVFLLLFILRKSNKSLSPICDAKKKSETWETVGANLADLHPPV
jgi:hypothetical protein